MLKKQTKTPLLCLIVILLLLAGCKGKPADSRPLIITSIYPYQLLIQDLVGDSVRVQSIIPANASPHTFSAKPADLRSLDEAKLLVMNGLDLEGELFKAFLQRKDKLVDISTLVDLPLVDKDEPTSDHDHHHGGHDPHLWLSPQFLIKITIQMGDRLQTAFPHLAQTIGANTASLVASLAGLHQQISSERSQYSNPALITYHDSFHWFARDYDIEVLGTVQSSPGTEPTPKQLTQLGDSIRANKIKAIFVEPQMDRRSAKVLAAEFGLQILELDPLGDSIKAQHIGDLLWTNWQRMKQGWDAAVSP
ncbi:MAG: zinc ABC transporter substrate-binding protein [Candidatus Cloacimonetes bacterium]|nr:zinc ABC transporter substrate-binding protein [Candidatus Cloacimonadota bacterium]